MKNSTTLARLVAFSLSFTALGAQAHTGHDTHSLMAGLVHPLSADHLLAMVAVGLWSIRALPARQVWQGPAVFMLALLLSAALGAVGVSVPFLEHAIALSVVLFGSMLLFNARHMSRPLGLGLIAAAASLHGLAHGAEMPTTECAGYAFGFVLTTGLLHLGVIGIGQAIHRAFAERSALAVSGLGAALGSSGLLLLSQL